MPVTSPIPPVSLAVLVLCALIASAVLTELVRRVAAGRGVLDVPNARSSHQMPTPRGGGLAIVLVTTAAVTGGAIYGFVSPALALALGVGGVAVATVGLLDDRRSLPARVRLAVHFGAAFCGLTFLGGPPSLAIGGSLIDLGWAGYLLGALAVVWAINLFNFMDGIDGIATSEAVFVAGGASVLTLVAGGAASALVAPLVFAAACLGFLLWNWPPARIFLGDVGSGYLGYVIAMLAVDAARREPAALWAWLILGGAFFADATLTLARRTLRHERLHEAHRSHAYQWLARRWGSHLRVTLAVLLINTFWLLPWGALASFHSAHAALIAAIALVPLVALALAMGAGRSELARRA